MYAAIVGGTVGGIVGGLVLMGIIVTVVGCVLKRKREVLIKCLLRSLFYALCSMLHGTEEW